MKRESSKAATTRPRSQRELLGQLKSLVLTSGNEKKFLLEYDELNSEKVGRTTVYDALHGSKIGIKLTALLDRIKGYQDERVEKDAGELNTGFTTKLRDSKGNETDPSPRRSANAGVDGKKTRTRKSSYELTRSISEYVMQLQQLISAAGSERKFFSQYAKFNVANAVRSTVYTAIHDGKVRAALAQMLDKINAAAPNVVSKKSPRPTVEKAKTGHGVEILPKDDLGEAPNA